MPKVSICIPCHERPDTLKRTLDSVFEQSFEDYEVVITDNSKSDNIQTLINRYNATKIIYKRHEKNIGMTPNINASIQFSSGDYIKPMFSDDWFTHQDSLAELVRLLDVNKTSDFVFCGSLNVGENKKRRTTITEEEAHMIKKNPTRLFVGNVIGAPSVVLYRRNRLLFDTRLEWLLDIDFYIRSLLLNSQINYTTEPLVSIGIHETQATQKCIENRAMNIEEYRYLYSKYALHTDRMCRSFMFRVLRNNRADVFVYRQLGFGYSGYLNAMVLNVMRWIKRKIL